MSGTGTIVAVGMMVGAAATLGIAHQQNWGAFGEFDQSLTTSETCQAQILAIGWASGAGASRDAENRALIKWSKRAARHGDLYASWHNARSRDVTCSTLPRRGAKCTVKGRPCERHTQPETEISLF